MNIDSYIDESIFSEKEKHKFFYELIWENFKESGYVIADEDGHEIDCIVKAFSLQNLLNEFAYRLYDQINETDYEDVLESLATLEYYEDDITEYCKDFEEIEIDDDDFSVTAKNMLDYITELTSEKMLEEYSADDIFDFMFSATYDFEQDFVFDFEDVDEFEAFVDSNSERLDEFKEEYTEVMNWVEQGMIC